MGKKWQAKNFKPLECTASLVDFRGKFNSQIMDIVIENWKNLLVPLSLVVLYIRYNLLYDILEIS